jgi:hypothetical protein
MHFKESIFRGLILLLQKKILLPKALKTVLQNELKVCVAMCRTPHPFLEYHVLFEYRLNFIFKN